MDNCENNNFRCPRQLPPSVADERFCVPDNCPKGIPTPRFASPNSPLPQNQLERLQACIEKVNELLRSVGNPRDPENLTGLRLHFRMLRGLRVQVEVDCGEQKEHLAGVLEEAGQNFLQLAEGGIKRFILFLRLCAVKREDEGNPENNHECMQELLNIDPCLRRDLVLRFGEVVSKNPFLINVFFGIPLNMRLADFLNSMVQVKRESGDIVQGVLTEVEENQIRVKVNKREETINFNEICFIEIL